MGAFCIAPAEKGFSAKEDRQPSRRAGRVAVVLAVPHQAAMQGPRLAQPHRLQEFCSTANSRQIPFICLFRFRCRNCII